MHGHHASRLPQAHHHLQPAASATRPERVVRSRFDEGSKRPTSGLQVVVTLGLSLLTACTPDNEDTGALAISSAGALLPDTATVDGVLQMRHGVDAFARAPQYTIDRVPLVVFDGGEDPDFDLSYAQKVILLEDGRGFALSRMGGARLMLFGEDGRPIRMLARQGEGPGDLMAPSVPTAIDGDTLMLFDGPLVKWYTAGNGFVRSMPVQIDSTARCRGPVSLLRSGRLLALGQDCRFTPEPDTNRRAPLDISTMNLDFTDAKRLATVPGPEQMVVETRYRGRRDHRTMEVRFGRRALVVPWGDDIAVATGEDGYAIDRLTVAGTLVSRIAVAVPRRPVTVALRERMIDEELSRMSGPATEGMVDPEESRRQVRERPYADSLTPYRELSQDQDGILWAIDMAVLTDTMVTATAFRPDGAIVARLTIPRLAVPVAFHAGRVMLWEQDDDGVVRFGVYRIVADAAGLKPRV